jgi:hypothetical protein
VVGGGRRAIDVRTEPFLLSSFAQFFLDQHVVFILDELLHEAKL